MRSQKIHLIDTPFIDDSSSVEVDISNSLGIIEAFSKVRSVRPVILLNYKQLEGRGE